MHYKHASLAITIIGINDAQLVRHLFVFQSQGILSDLPHNMQ